MLEISSETRNQSNKSRGSNWKDLLDNVLEDWKLLLGCHVGRQDLRHRTRLGRGGDSIPS